MSLVSGLQGLAVPLSGHAPGCADSRVLRFAVDTLGRVAHIRNHILRNLLYIQSPIYNRQTHNEYQKGDTLPTVRINSTDGVVHFSDGLQSGMLVVEKSDALSAKENRNTIRF